jgi:hypothetical protein
VPKVPKPLLSEAGVPDNSATVNDDPAAPQRATHTKRLADIDPDERGISYAQWKAREPNRIFAEHGAGGPGHITSATVQHGLEKEANREPIEPAEPQDATPRQPPTRRERERLAAEGERDAHDAGLPLEKRCRGLLKLIESHFWRSCESWEGTRRIRWDMRERRLD